MSDFYNHKDDWYRIELNLNEHKDDTIKHITTEERDSWNAKATASDIETAINTHNTSVAHGYLVPNWSGAVAVTGSDNVAQYTAPTHGIIYVTNNMDSSSGQGDVYVNGMLVSQIQETGNGAITHTYVIASGDTIKFDCTRMDAVNFVEALPDPVAAIPGHSLYILFVPFKTV